MTSRPSPRKQLARLRRHQDPAWWTDAKLGIFIHWTLAAVPAFAPRESEYKELLIEKQHDAFSLSPYVEWYENSLRFPGSPVANFHREHFGDAPYSSFAPIFEAGLASWDPEQWAAQFAGTGARYVVLVAKHHDGYCLWPSDVPNPHRPGWNSSRDIVGELADAVRAQGMRFGIYYSGGLDWTFCNTPMGSLGSLMAAVPQGDYPAYAEAQVRELIERYQPSVLWNDIAWPQRGPSLWKLFADYYEAVPDGVVNDRWMPYNAAFRLAKSSLGRSLIDRVIARQTEVAGGLVPPKPPYFDVRTPEYVTFPTIQRTPFECVRGMDHSFGYNAASTPEDFISRDDLLWLLADITAKGGNLLLNVGPRGRDAQIPDEQQERLAWLAGWSPTTARALQGTRPFTQPGTETPEGAPLRYATRGRAIYAILQHPGREATLTGVHASPTSTVTDSGGSPLDWRASDQGLVVQLGDRGMAAEPVVVVIHDGHARSGS